MCGIFGICQNAGECAAGGRNPAKWIPLLDAYNSSSLMHHRGPDMRSYYKHPTNGNILFHERLAINDLDCFQPIQGSAETRQLHAEHCPDTPNRTTCDSEIIIQLFDKFHDSKSELCNLLDGVFAIALIYDDEFFAARDPIGVKPLYFGVDQAGRFFCSSEMKAIQGFCSDGHVGVFPPGHFYTPQTNFVRYFEPLWMSPSLVFRTDTIDLLREMLIAATHKRLMSDAPLGMLLSGRLDSSLICAIAARELRRQGRPLRTFSVGLSKESPDLIAARKVAEFLGTDHTEVHFTVKEGISLLSTLVYHLESYDVTTIRASTPMYFLTKRLRAEGIKVALSGEGADEIFGGYLYFHNAPSLEEFHKETVSRVCRLSYADVLRADKSCMANGVEIRVPFLDKKFLEVALSLDPVLRSPTCRNGEGRAIEKHLLRKAFDNPEDPYIPEEVLWRQKEQFSDGIGYSWIDALKLHAESIVTDEQLSNAPFRYPIQPPKTKEAYLIRRIFEQHFPSDEAAMTVAVWTPKWQESEDPSGRFCAVHEQTHHQNNGVSK